MSTRTNFKLLLAGILAILCGMPAFCPAQDVFEPTGIFAQPVQGDQPQALPRLADSQIDELLAPIALYPDPLLAQVLPAATYPDEVAQAAQWLQENPQFDESALDAQRWEPSIKALVHYPAVLQMMIEHPEWTQALGAAFLAQQDEMMDSIQRLRRQAADAGSLVSTEQQQVLNDDGVIQIMPPSPEVIYVPVYDPQVVYVETAQPVEPLITFGFGYQMGSWLDNGCDWHRRWIARGGGWHAGWRFEDRHWNRDTRPVIVGSVRFPSVRSLPDRYARAALNPWSHNATKPRPALTPSLVSRALSSSRGGSFVRGGADRLTANRLPPDRLTANRNPWSAHVPPSLSRPGGASPVPPMTHTPSTVRPNPNPFAGRSMGERPRVESRPPTSTAPPPTASSAAKPWPGVTAGRDRTSSSGRPTIYWPRSSTGETPRTFGPPSAQPPVSTPRPFTPPTTPRTFIPPSVFATPRTITPPTRTPSTESPRTFGPPTAPRSFTPPTTPRTFTPRTFTPPTRVPSMETPRTFSPPTRTPSAETPRTFRPPASPSIRTFSPPAPVAAPRTFTPAPAPRTFSPPAPVTSPRTFSPPTPAATRTFTPPSAPPTPRTFAPTGPPPAARTFTPPAPSAAPRTFSPSSPSTPAGSRSGSGSAGRTPGTSSDDRGRGDSGGRSRR